MVGADIFFVKNKTLLCIVDSYSKFSIVKKLTVSQLMTWLKQPRLYSQSLDSPQKLFRYRHKIHIRDVQTILQTDEHRTEYNISLSPPEEWSCGCMYKIHEMYNQNRP